MVERKAHSEGFKLNGSCVFCSYFAHDRKTLRVLFLLALFPSLFCNRVFPQFLARYVGQIN